MEDQKIENLLNLAAEATQEERERSGSLEVGYDPLMKTWEVIVRYSGSLQESALPQWKIVVLSGGYAIITLPGQDLDYLAGLPQIEYIEKPKRLYFGVNAGRAASCINGIQMGVDAAGDLYGKGVLIALIDSGVDYFHPDFREDDGSSRILYLWDQTQVYRAEEQRVTGQEKSTEEAENLVENSLNFDRQGGKVSANEMLPVGKVPEGFAMGVEYTEEEINRALAAGSQEAGLAIVPEQDFSGHGTEVLGIAAGNGRASGGRYRGVAPQSSIIAVKLGIPGEQGFPRTTELMQAIEYVYQKAEQLALPMAVNISFGNSYGSHRGNSLVETYINLMAASGRTVIAVGTGNEGNSGGHAAGKLKEDAAQKRRTVQGAPSAGAGEKEVELLVSDFETSLSLQIWKDFADEIRILIIHPDGSAAGPFGQEIGASRYRLGRTELLVYYGEPSPYQAEQEIYVEFIPLETYIDSGIWRIILQPGQIVTGEYQMWLPDARARNRGTRFLQPDVDTTLTIPSAAARVIAVGAYDARQNAAASFSGRGWPDERYPVRPDLAAPGVAVTTTAAGGGYISVSGTSFAAPFVTGSAALMMEWGIVLNKDPFLYGEKVRAYLRRGARQLPGFEVWPNNVLGYGALCLRESLPV